MVLYSHGAGKRKVDGVSLHLHPDIRSATNSYLAAADRLLPGAITAAAIGGSVALSAYRPGSSDIDVVAAISDQWRERPDLIRRLRLLHLSQLPRLAGRTLSGKGASACCNTSFLWDSELSLPVTSIRPIAAHTGEQFTDRGAFDVNPVIWHQLTTGGIVLRGGDIETWGLNPEPEKLKPWTRKNLLQYWKPLMEKTRGSTLPIRPSQVEWCLLGPVRMHATLQSGEVISKLVATQHALNQFPEHAPIIRVAQAQLTGERRAKAPPRRHWRSLTVDCMAAIINDATELPSGK